MDLIYGFRQEDFCKLVKQSEIIAENMTDNKVISHSNLLTQVGKTPYITYQRTQQNGEELMVAYAPHGSK